MSLHYTGRDLHKNSLRKSERERETERERERKKESGGSDRPYVEGGSETIIFDLKVPRHCPLVLLVRVRLEFRVN
jgi:hypothetical protein